MCFLGDLNTGGTIGKGASSQGLYRLAIPKSFEAPTDCSVIAFLQQIHCRLGNPSLASLKQMVPSLSNVSQLECQSCQLGYPSWLVLSSLCLPGACYTNLLVHILLNRMGLWNGRIETLLRLHDLIHMTVPTCLWGDALLTTCYLVTRMSSWSNFQFFFLHCNLLTSSIHLWMSLFCSSVTSTFVQFISLPIKCL